jgi:hypothetical protein
VEPDARPGRSLVVTVRLTLRAGRDDDLIALVRMAPRGKLASMVREAMRSGVSVHQAAFDVDQDSQPVDLSSLGVEL